VRAGPGGVGRCRGSGTLLGSLESVVGGTAGADGVVVGAAAGGGVDGAAGGVAAAGGSGGAAPPVGCASTRALIHGSAPTRAPRTNLRRSIALSMCRCVASACPRPMLTAPASRVKKPAARRRTRSCGFCKGIAGTDLMQPSVTQALRPAATATGVETRRPCGRAARTTSRRSMIISSMPIRGPGGAAPTTTLRARMRQRKGTRVTAMRAS
jgi:hypothetical protein